MDYQTDLAGVLAPAHRVPLRAPPVEVCRDGGLSNRDVVRCDRAEAIAMRRLNSSDALMLRLDRGNAYNHTLKIAVLDPSTDPQGWSRSRMQQIMRERIHLLPVFRQRCLPTPLGIHQPIWVDDPEFDLDAHVRYVACPPPRRMREFCAPVVQGAANPLGPNRPWGQLWIVEGLAGERVALVTLFHHAY